MKEKLPEEAVAMRIAKELKSGMYVNLGVGVAANISSYFTPESNIHLHSENGILSSGRVVTIDEPELMDLNLVNAAGYYLLPRPGMSIFDVAKAFDMVRVGRIDATVLGALQVSEKGDLANWTIDPGGQLGNIGGAMDMPIGAKRVIVGMTHTTKQDEPKIRKKCTLPLTAPACVDLIVTDVAVIEVTGDGLVLKEFVPNWSVEDIQEITEPKLIVSPDLKEMELF